LLSNAGAREVGARKIEISYTKDKEGHIFEVKDDGCGMNFTGSQLAPGRLDRFLGLGLSGIIGMESDEFAWKGLGSKLAFQSRRIEIQTKFRSEKHPLYEVRINEPWDTIERKLIPKPRINEHESTGEPSHTRIRVIGHPPHRHENPFTLEEIRNFLLHRTFAGFTTERDNPPGIVLSVLGNEDEVQFGFPVFRGIDWREGIWFSDDKKTLFVNLSPSSPKKITVRLKGLLTWTPQNYRLSSDNLNIGLILSCKGIPYFTLDLEELGARGITHANPGIEKTCLVAECDLIQTEMNISRSDLVDSEKTSRFKDAVKELLQRLESSQEYLGFRQVPKKERQIRSAGTLNEEMKKLTGDDQSWVVFQGSTGKPNVLMREPENENEVNAMIWKLEALDALPFEQFQTLAYPGAKRGPDMLVNFREDSTSAPAPCAVFEVERNFYSYTGHGHHASQYPRVICWDTPSGGRKVRLTETNKKYKFTVNMEEFQVHVFVLRRMPGIEVLTRRQLRDRELDI
ncbi:MAG: hypothetical protein ACP5FY_10290, partial [Kosmotogaceae bacterium]